MEIKHRYTGAVLRITWTDTLRGANLRGADLQGADLRDADLRDADLRDAYLRDADLRGAYLRGAYLQGAYLRDANLRDANLQGALYSPSELIIQYMCVGPIGSRSDYLQIFQTEKRTMLHTGCFVGTIDEFQTAVTATHDGNPHGADYQAAITFIRTLMPQ